MVATGKRCTHRGKGDFYVLCGSFLLWWLEISRPLLNGKDCNDSMVVQYFPLMIRFFLAVSSDTRRTMVRFVKLNVEANLSVHRNVLCDKSGPVVVFCWGQNTSRKFLLQWREDVQCRVQCWGRIQFAHRLRFFFRHVIIGQVNSFLKLSYFWYLKRLNLYIYILPKINYLFLLYLKGVELIFQTWSVSTPIIFGLQPLRDNYCSSSLAVPG